MALIKRYEFQFSRNAEYMFAHLDRTIQKRILKKLTFWQQTANPLHFSQPLKERGNTFRFRVGDYRIIVTPRATGVLTILLVLKVGHRKDVYEE